ncbi:metalloproteinase inhibitor 4-like [Brachyhypopomus gauderio]|uniref:metalloproteinase inhibitor 4-like n=1 Tax=Brachyhypopomus gauderio TaxID=698409 RepID=UPI0040432798
MDVGLRGHGALLLGLVLALALMDPRVEGCTCQPAHPQEHFCQSEIVIRAKISGEKIISPSNSSSPYQKMIQYEIKLIKMFKGFDKIKDIQYVYTPVFSSLCGVKLDASYKVQYLLTGNMWSEGKVSIGLCDFIEPWDNLSLAQKKNLNYRYQMGCDCIISTCYTAPCCATSENECLWTDWLVDNKLSVQQARQYACIKRTDGSCSWYRGSAGPDKDFTDASDP